MSEHENPPLPSRKRMLMHALVAFVIFAIAMVVASILFSTKPQMKARKPSERRAILVEVEAVKIGEIALRVRANGVASAAEQLQLQPQVQGKVISIDKALVPGRIVKKGSTLISIERGDYQLQVEQAKSAVAQAQASISIEGGNQDIAKMEAGLLEELEIEGNQDLVLRKPQWESAQANLASAKAQLKQAKLNLSRTSLTAPFNGVVISRNVALGQLVNEQSVVAIIANTDAWWIEAEVPISGLHHIESGTEVRVRSPSVWGDQEKLGTVVEVGAQVEARGRLARVLVAVEDPLSLKSKAEPKMYINSRYDLEIVGEVLPNAARLKPEWIRGASLVWLLNSKGELEERTVRVASRDDTEVVVSEGLKEGDRLITSELASPVTGMKLRTKDTAKGAPKKPGKRAPKAAQ